MLTGNLQINKECWYSIEETCNLLEMCRKTLRKYTRAGYIKGEVHPATKQLRYRGLELEKFFNQRP